jgi:hypothetical protein
VVKEGDTLTYYRNGEPSNEGVIVDPMYSPDPLPLYMAGQNDVEVWRGYLSDVQLYTDALSQAEIRAIMSGGGGAEPMLQAGDADMDCDFDQLDLVQVQVAAKYLTGETATWGEGDWNGAPGGSVVDKAPPPGDGRFDQQDIIAALSAGLYLTGSYCAGAEANAMAMPVPEPSSFLLFVLGLGTMMLTRRRR